MKKGIESTDSQANESKKIDPLKSNAGTAANKASLFSEQGGEKVHPKRASKEKRDQGKDLSNEFFLADFELEQ
ncbi:MAG: hypothetical protein JRC86_01265 [Deltaproteobacteria bacterium]|nr:hypothetical protein [Deltaproteobacteria bacterium]